MNKKGLLEKEGENFQEAKKKQILMNKLDKELQHIFLNLESGDDFFHDNKKITFTELLDNKLMVVFLIRNGIPFSFFSLIRDLSPFSLNDWASYLDVSTKTLDRYQSQGKYFKSIHTEKIIEMAEVTKLGQEVFGSDEKFRLWLNTPNFALGKLKPFDLLKDSYGKDLLIGELTRIEHGILA